VSDIIAQLDHLSCLYAHQEHTKILRDNQLASLAQLGNIAHKEPLISPQIFALLDITALKIQPLALKLLATQEHLMEILAHPSQLHAELVQQESIA
jgi:hypothetical protein